MVRRSLKKDKQQDALKRDLSSIRFTEWKNGKPVSSKLKKNYFELQNISLTFTFLLLSIKVPCTIALTRGTDE